MKSLIIIGVPRAGKSTLANAVAKKIGCTDTVSLIAIDAIRGGLDNVRNKNHFYKGFVRPAKHMSKTIQKRQQSKSIRETLQFTERFLKEMHDVSTVIFEGYYISPQTAVKLFNKDDFKIVAIGYPNIDLETKCKAIRKYDKDTPTNRLDDERLKKRLENFIKESKRIEKDSKNLGIHFIDTSKNYNQTIKDFADNVLEFLSE